MRTILSILIACFVVSTATAQTKQTTLNGTLVMKTGETFPYKIVFSDSGNWIKGYSFTYKEPNETKATIRGKLDKQMRTLTFKERDIVYSHNVQTKAFMCLVNANLEYVPEGNIRVLKGPITSREADNTACTEGEIIFRDEKELQNLFAYHEQFDTVITMKKKVREPVAEVTPGEAVPQQEPLVAEKITAGADRSYEWHSDTVVVDVWDGGHVDGDKITMQLNGKVVLSDYTLIKTKKQLKLPLTGTGVNTIMITADNEGNEPPNTATLTLYDGAVKYNILAYNKKGDAALIKVKRVR